MQFNEIRGYLVSALRLNEDNKEKDSYYGEYKLGGDGLLVIRVSNHRTYLSTWDERYKPTQQANRKVMRRMGKNLPDIFRNKTFYSFVFEDGDTVGNIEVPSGRRIIVNETVYKSTDLNLENLRSIKEGIYKLARTGQYDKSVLGQYQVISNRSDSGLFLLKNLIEESIHNYFMNISNYQYINENNQINCNKNMNRNSKNVVRLTESELRDMIKESVNQILFEDIKGTVNNLRGAYKSGKESFKSSQEWDKQHDKALKNSSKYGPRLYIHNTPNTKREQRDAEKGVDMVLKYISNAKIPVTDVFMDLLSTKIEELSHKYWNEKKYPDEPLPHRKWW